MLLPSSHASPTTTPSPHFEVHAPLLQIGSLWQSAEQPSNGSVLPSSQVSAPSMTPSPHLVVVQTLGLPLHLCPSSILHVDEQPSPSAVLPSSQASSEVRSPLPHMGGFVGVGSMPTPPSRRGALPPRPVRMA